MTSRKLLKEAKKAIRQHNYEYKGYKLMVRSESRKG